MRPEQIKIFKAMPAARKLELSVPCPLQAWGLSHRQAIEPAPGKSLWIAPREYVILKKLEYYREGHSEKHLLDIRGMLDVSGDGIDQAILQDYIKRMHLEDEWKLVLHP